MYMQKFAHAVLTGGLNIEVVVLTYKSQDHFRKKATKIEAHSTPNVKKKKKTA